MTDKKSWHDRETLEGQSDDELKSLHDKLAMLHDDNRSDVENESSPHYTWKTLDFWDDTIHVITDILQRRKGILPVHWNMGDETACDSGIEGDSSDTDFKQCTCHWCKEIYYGIQRAIQEAKEGKVKPISTLWDDIEVE